MQLAHKSVFVERVVLATYRHILSRTHIRVLVVSITPDHDGSIPLQRDHEYPYHVSFTTACTRKNPNPAILINTIPRRKGIKR